MSIQLGACQLLPSGRGYISTRLEDDDSVTVQHYSGSLSAPCSGGAVDTLRVLKSTCSSLSNTVCDSQHHSMPILMPWQVVLFAQLSSSAAFSIPCRSRVVTHRRHLAYYIEHECTSLAGDLVIASLEHVTVDELNAAFGMIETIDGNLVIRGSPGIVTLDFLSSLWTVQNVTLSHNVNLVDARIITLESVGMIDNSHNERLCPARHLSLTLIEETADCVSVDGTLIVMASGYLFFSPRIIGYLHPVDELLTRGIRDLLPGQVCSHD